MKLNLFFSLQSIKMNPLLNDMSTDTENKHSL